MIYIYIYDIHIVIIFFSVIKPELPNLWDLTWSGASQETQVTPLVVFDGLDFDGDRIVNLRVRRLPWLVATPK